MASMVLWGLNPRVPNTKCECKFIPVSNTRYIAAVLTRFPSLECQICGFKLLWPRPELMIPFWWSSHKDWIMKLACSLLWNWPPFWWSWHKDWVMKLARTLLWNWTPFWWNWHKDWVMKLACTLLWNWAWVTQHPPVHHLKNPILGFHGWNEIVPQGSVYLVSIIFLLLLFSSAQFLFPSSVFYFLGTVFIPLFFLAHTWIKICSGKLLPTPNLPTTLLPTNPPPSLMLPTPPHPAICTHFQCSLVLFLPSPSPVAMHGSPLWSQEELRSLGGGQEELSNKAQWA